MTTGSQLRSSFPPQHISHLHCSPEPFPEKCLIQLDWTGILTRSPLSVQSSCTLLFYLDCTACKGR